MENLIRDLAARYDFDEECVEYLKENLVLRTYDKDEEVVATGGMNPSVYFIRKGVWRTSIFRDGEEWTLWFSVAGDYDLSPWCQIDVRPSRYTITSSSRSEAVEFSQQLIVELSQRSSAFLLFMRDLYARMMLHTDEVLLTLSSPNAKDRYLALIDDLPEVCRLVAQKEVARFLGITPQSLSRIRRQIKEAKAPKNR